MPESPPEPATLRSIHERCKTRHNQASCGCHCWLCGQPWPCADYSDAVAALALLNTAKRGMGCEHFAIVPDPVGRPDA